jgi:NADH-quinone oxidoreductase subunit K
MGSSVPLDHVLILAGLLFSLGLFGVLVRRNILFVLMSIEAMMNSAGLAFIASGSRWAEADGQVMFVLVLSLAGAEASVGLALVLQIYKRFATLDTDAASAMRG